MSWPKVTLERGAAGKTPVFRLLKRNGKVFVMVVPNCLKEELMFIIQRGNPKRLTIYTDGWKTYDGLIFNDYNHYRIFHHENEFVRGKSHVNGLECFWSYTKFNGLTNTKFNLYLKESTCKFSRRNDNFAYFIEQIFWGKL